jgi:hypothetical protein
VYDNILAGGERSPRLLDVRRNITAEPGHRRQRNALEAMLGSRLDLRGCDRRATSRHD